MCPPEPEPESVCVCAALVSAAEPVAPDDGGAPGLLGVTVCVALSLVCVLVSAAAAGVSLVLMAADVFGFFADPESAAVLVEWSDGNLLPAVLPSRLIPLAPIPIFGVIALFACVTCVLPASGLPGD